MSLSDLKFRWNRNQYSVVHYIIMNSKGPGGAKRLVLTEQIEKLVKDNPEEIELTIDYQTLTACQIGMVEVWPLLNTQQQKAVQEAAKALRIWKSRVLPKVDSEKLEEDITPLDGEENVIDEPV